MEHCYYRYAAPSLVNEVTVVTDEAGAKRAFLHASENAGLAELQHIKTELAAKHMLCIPSDFNNSPVLEVRGFTDNEQVLSRLRANRWTVGQAETVKDASERLPLGQVIKKRSMQLSGLFMIIADIGYMMYGAKERKWEDTLAGLSYLTGSSVLMGYGRLDQSDIRIREIAKMLVDYGKHRGLDMSTESAATDAIKKRPETIFRKTHNLLRNNPSEIGNMCYFLAGGLIAKSALQHHALAPARPGMTAEQLRDVRKEGWQDTGLGTMTMTSGLIATFMDEKKTDPDIEQPKGITGAIQYLKNNPLALASYGYIGSTLCHAFSTATAFTRAKKDCKDMALSVEERAMALERLKSIPWRALFVTSTIIGEILLSISSKGHGAGVVHDDTVRDSVMSLAADHIVRQPKHLQNDVISHIADYLGSADVLAIGDAEAEKCLRAKIECIKKNPWAMNDREALPVKISERTLN